MSKVLDICIAFIFVVLLLSAVKAVIDINEVGDNCRETNLRTFDGGVIYDCQALTEKEGR